MNPVAELPLGLAAELPAWAALATALLLVLGAGLTLLGSFGLVRLNSFYDRIHAPTLGTTLGITCILAASMLFFSVRGGRPVLHEVLIGLFVAVTTPVTLMLLSRAALYRDRREGIAEVAALDVARPAQESTHPVMPPGPGRGQPPEP